jgi:hypothetical protein
LPETLKLANFPCSRNPFAQSELRSDSEPATMRCATAKKFDGCPVLVKRFVALFPFEMRTNPPRVDPMKGEADNGQEKTIDITQTRITACWAPIWSHARPCGAAA